VDLVLNTHLHADHCSGNTGLAGDEVVPVFPQAEYWVQRVEWAQATHPDVRTRNTYHRQNFEPLDRGGQLRLLHGDTRVTDHVTCVVTSGHTRGHQSIMLQSGDWRGMFLGDMATYAVHMANAAWLTAFDVLPLENIRTKRRWQGWAYENAAWLFFEHDPYTAVGILRKRERGYRVEAVGAAAELIEDLPRLRRPRE
jgi:glyoxylase-like metal-dependent hydrolase (beta-lactamase superfamily II)